MTIGTVSSSRRTLIQTGIVSQNRLVCRDHFRMTITVNEFDECRPGQFVHLCPATSESADYGVGGNGRGDDHRPWWNGSNIPMLRRAFSVANLERRRDGVDIDVIYRVVGTATRWLASLRNQDPLSVMGPLGREFPVSDAKANAWLIAGGVGLPPLLWLAKTLHESRKKTVAFCGVQSADLLALRLDPQQPPALDAKAAIASAAEFSEVDTPVVISSDDGSLGFRGHVGAAMEAYAQANPPKIGDLVVYTCGPERMMRFVADFCARRAIECYVCVERNMACGTGMCQSCIVPVRDETNSDGWRYRLCCTDGPVFDAGRVIWD